MMRRTNNAPETLAMRLGSADAVRAARARRKGPITARKTKAQPASPKPKKRKAKVASPRKKAPAKARTGKTRRAAPATDRSVRMDAAAVRARQRWVIGGLMVVGLVLVGRAFQLQLVDGETYASAAVRQATTAVEIKGRRGLIYDRQQTLLATTVEVDSVFAEPRRIESPASIAAELAPILRRPAKQLQAKLRSNAAFTYLARRVEPQVGSAVRQLNLAGVGTHRENRRFYPHTHLAAHVLGFVNIDGEGRAGVERVFDDRLGGGSASVASMRDALGQKVMVGGLTPPEELAGRPLTLTLDRRVQHASEQALREALRTSGGRAGAVVVLDARTSDVLALASAPTFNPNNLDGSGPTHHLNRAVSAVYEPGSTAKVLTLASALQESVVSADDRMDCEDGRWQVGRRTIRDADHRYGELSIEDVLAKSSNICMAKLGMELGAVRLHRWLSAFGLGKVTGIELPGEVDGLMRPPSAWQSIDLANVAFGQGIAVTPLQLAQAINVVAAGGVLRAPRLVAGAERPPARRVLTPQVAGTLTRMMEAVVLRGTGRKAGVAGVRVAGKTGTAQKFDPLSKTYSHEKYVASFVGFAPAESPEITVLVLIDEPTTATYGGQVAGPAFATIMSEALRTRGHVVAPAKRAEEPVPAPRADGPDAEIPPPPGQDAPVLEAALSDAALSVLGLDENEEGDPEVMPHLGGLGVHEVLRRCEVADCVPVLLGTGWVRKQHPRPGATVARGAIWRVELSADQRTVR
ncbi:MAG: penicillin-binding transpeptidase domain-containing protein [Myxococcota bacterium]